MMCKIQSQNFTISKLTADVSGFIWTLTVSETDFILSIHQFGFLQIQLDQFKMNETDCFKHHGIKSALQFILPRSVVFIIADCW